VDRNRHSSPIRFTVSAGVAQFDPAQGGWQTMMRRAETAMYEAKERDRNFVHSDAGTVVKASSASPSSTFMEPAIEPE
jgi:hypothetical protein